VNVLAVAVAKRLYKQNGCYSDVHVVAFFFPFHLRSELGTEHVTRIVYSSVCKYRHDSLEDGLAAERNQ